jgi:hypothetical protein
MTQDQYGQARGPGYVVRGDVVPDDETEEFTSDQARPMTRFQKVASALRADGPEQDEHDRTADQAAADEGAAGTAATDAAAGDRAEAVAVTSPDAGDHEATEPDMFGTTAHAGNGVTPVPAEGQAGAATIADVPVGDVPAGGVPAGDAPGSPSAGAPAAAPAGTTGRHAAAGSLGDFSDLTYGNLIPEAAQYTDQWRQIQYKFVDDPHASVTEAADIVAQVTAKMEAAIQERQRAIEERQRAIAEQQRSLRGRWGDGTNADTEALRETLRMYKTFLDQLIGPRAG